jgi:hypothetical protein
MSKSHTAGERNGLAKITQADAIEIVETAAYDAEHGYRPGSIKELSLKFGLSRAAVREIARGNRWKHIQPAPERGARRTKRVTPLPVLFPASPTPQGQGRNARASMSRR